MPDPKARTQRRLLIAAAAAGALAVAALIVVLNLPGNVSNPNLSFTASGTSPSTTIPHQQKTFLWPNYGYDAARTRDFTSAGGTLRPPFKKVWTFGGNALLEFPPTLYAGNLYFVDDGGTVKDVNAITGKQVWAAPIGSLSASTPALDPRNHRLYVALLAVHGRTPHKGELAALSMRTGKVAWKFPVAPGTESSPLIRGHSVYFGDQGGTVYALNTKTGRVEWKYQASGSVKGGVAYAGGLLYFGDYAGRVYALRARNGHQVWAMSTSGAELGFGSGNFYSTPAVAFGRVYLGNTDGYVYSFAANSGQLAWRTATGAYVYSSPAVADPPGLGPTVYIGSYDGYFYAFNARSGQIRWRHHDGARISGASTIIDGDVYYSDLGRHTTTGLSARTGRPVFHFADGAFTPMIADNSAVFLVGYNTLYRLEPASQSKSKPKSKSSNGTSRRAAPSKRRKSKHKARRHASSKRRSREHRATTRRRHRRTVKK